MSIITTWMSITTWVFLMLASCLVGVSGVLSSLATISSKKRAECFTAIVLWRPVSVSLPQCAVVFSAVCDCGISWSYSHTV